MKKSILFFTSTLLFLVLTSITYYGCKKKSTESCNDGIQNQGETGVDCGGPCAACAVAANVLCNGNGQTTYYPLKLNNYWNYSVQSASWDYSITVKGTAVYNTLTYFELEAYDVTSYLFYLRTATNGDIYRYFTGGVDQEYLEVPASPTASQTWPYYVSTAVGTRVVVSTNATLSTASCSYTGCLKIEERDSGGALFSTSYYKKGIGMIEHFVFGATDLKQVTLK